MIRFTVLYPATEHATFDHEYFRDSHVPLALKAWGLRFAEVERGISGPYEAAVHYRFESIDALGAAMVSHDMGDVLADIANYTTIGPVVQISEIVGP